MGRIKVLDRDGLDVSIHVTDIDAVHLAVSDETETARVALTAAEARNLAAWLLERADWADEGRDRRELSKDEWLALIAEVEQ